MTQEKEAKYCAQIAFEWGKHRGVPIGDPLPTDLVMRERAAVRAEVAIELACLRKDVEDWKNKCARLERELSELRR